MTQFGNGPNWGNATDADAQDVGCVGSRMPDKTLTQDAASLAERVNVPFKLNQYLFPEGQGITLGPEGRIYRRAIDLGYFSADNAGLESFLAWSSESLEDAIRQGRYDFYAFFLAFWQPDNYDDAYLRSPLRAEAYGGSPTAMLQALNCAYTNGSVITTQPVTPGARTIVATVPVIKSWIDIGVILPPSQIPPILGGDTFLPVTAPPAQITTGVQTISTGVPIVAAPGSATTAPNASGAVGTPGGGGPMAITGQQILTGLIVAFLGFILFGRSRG